MIYAPNGIITTITASPVAVAAAAGVLGRASWWSSAVVHSPADAPITELHARSCVSRKSSTAYCDSAQFRSFV